MVMKKEPTQPIKSVIGVILIIAGILLTAYIEGL